MRTIGCSFIGALALIACGARPVAPPLVSGGASGGALGEEEEAYASQEVVDPYVGYPTRAATFRTALGGPRPKPEPRESAPADAREIHYSSEVGSLRGWYARPPRSAGRRVPVVVYLHNDFALRREAWSNARPFVDAGYALLVPGLRGEDAFDDTYAALAASRARGVAAPLEHVRVPGDHMSSAQAAVADFLGRLRADGPACAPEQ
jgi:hypothetical protein